MDAERLNLWLSLVANIGVIAGIVFLVIEIQQSNRIAVASTEIAIRNTLASGNQLKYVDGDFANLIVKIGEEGADLSPADEWRISQYIVELLNVGLAIETAHANGMLPPETYGVIEDDMRSDMTKYPRTIPLYRRAYEQYPSLASTEVFRTLERVLQEHE
jgi:hypothetical protein